MVNEWIEWVELHINSLEQRVKKLEEEKNAQSQKEGEGESPEKPRV